MGKQIYFEDVKPESEIPAFKKQPTSRQLVKWAGASTDFMEIHYDKDFALGRGLPGVIVHGQLSASFLCQLITDWIGPQGKLKKVSITYRGMNFPGEVLTCKGNITNKYVDNGNNYVECAMWTENPRAEKTVMGNALVTLPSKK